MCRSYDLRHHDPHDAPRPVDWLLAHRTRHRRCRQPLLAPHAHRQVVARQVQHAALLVHAHDAEVAVVGGVEFGLVGLVGGFLEVFSELLLDLEETNDTEVFEEVVVEVERLPKEIILHTRVSVVPSSQVPVATRCAVQGVVVGLLQR